jgi:hypothetical protein
MSWLNRLARFVEPFTLPHLIRYLVIGQAVVLLGHLFNALALDRLVLLPAAVKAGEWWRVATFVFMPPEVLSGWGLLFAVMGLYLLFLYGSALEQIWGTARFNLFFGIGYVLTVGISFLTPLVPADNSFIYLTLFLAFAYLNPDMELLLFFVLPVKIKWIAMITWAAKAAFFIIGGWDTRLQILAAVGNFLLFFGGDILRRLRGTTAVLVTRPMSGPSDDRRPFRHQCRVCKRTEVSDPQLDFRYCSKCSGDTCYCSDHLKDHEHV